MRLKLRVAVLSIASLASVSNAQFYVAAADMNKYCAAVMPVKQDEQTKELERFQAKTLTRVQEIFKSLPMTLQSEILDKVPDRFKTKLGDNGPKSFKDIPPEFMDSMATVVEGYWKKQDERWEQLSTALNKARNERKKVNSYTNFGGLDRGTNIGKDAIGGYTCSWPAEECRGKQEQGCKKLDAFRDVRAERKNFAEKIKMEIRRVLDVDNFENLTEEQMNKGLKKYENYMRVKTEDRYHFFDWMYKFGKGLGEEEEYRGLHQKNAGQTVNAGMTPDELMIWDVYKTNSNYLDAFHYRWDPTPYGINGSKYNYDKEQANLGKQLLTLARKIQRDPEWLEKSIGRMADYSDERIAIEPQLKEFCQLEEKYSKRVGSPWEVRALANTQKQIADPDKFAKALETCRTLCAKVEKYEDRAGEVFIPGRGYQSKCWPDSQVMQEYYDKKSYTVTGGALCLDDSGGAKYGGKRVYPEGCETDHQKFRDRIAKIAPLPRAKGPDAPAIGGGGGGGRAHEEPGEPKKEE